jgi:hypothetical protein
LDSLVAAKSILVKKCEKISAILNNGGTFSLKSDCALKYLSKMASRLKIGLMQLNL